VTPGTLTKEQIEAAVWAFLKSSYVTATAVLCGLAVQAATDGKATDIPTLLVYFKTHWIAFTIAQVIAPTWRAYQAAKKVGNEANP